MCQLCVRCVCEEDSPVLDNVDYITRCQSYQIMLLYIPTVCYIMFENEYQIIYTLRLLVWPPLLGNISSSIVYFNNLFDSIC